MPSTACAGALPGACTGTALREDEWSWEGKGATGPVCVAPNSAFVDLEARALTLVATERASGLARLPDCSPAPYGSVSARLHLRLGSPISSAVSVLSTLPRRFCNRLTPMWREVSGQVN